MFDVGWSELLVIVVVALIAIGPKELPAVLRTVGQWTGKIRRMAAEFQGQFQEALREVEMADLQKQVKEVHENLTAPFDPLTMGEPAAKPASEVLPSQTTDQSAMTDQSVAAPPASPDATAIEVPAPGAAPVAAPSPDEKAAPVTPSDQGDRRA
jgi:sec-independent protein translocase protein TatB